MRTTTSDVSRNFIDTLATLVALGNPVKKFHVRIASRPAYLREHVGIQQVFHATVRCPAATLWDVPDPTLSDPDQRARIP
jgi:hypothetical protein